MKGAITGHPLRLALLLMVLTLTPASPAAAASPDYAPLDWLLARYVAEGEKNGVPLHRVDYLAWAADPEYPKVLTVFAEFDPARLESDAERLAFWINAYNLMAVKVVIDHRVTGSIKDAGSLFRSVWKRNAGTVGGRTVTLDLIEHAILRPMGDPRVHMAIVCASVSCPDLRREAYRPDQLNAQLDDQAYAFLANPAKGSAGTEAVTVSRIFDWFEADFESTGGVLAFVGRYREGLPPTRLNGYFKYDWALNGP